MTIDITCSDILSTYIYFCINLYLAVLKYTLALNEL
jgi:hypothetical protein